MLGNKYFQKKLKKSEEETAEMPYSFIVGNMRVNVLFSGKSEAPTLENALVKIAVRKER